MINSRSKWYVCSYIEPLTGGSYGVHLRADNDKDLEVKIDNLALQINVEGTGVDSGGQHRCSTWAKKSEKHFEAQLDKVLHHVCFVANFATARKDRTPPVPLLFADTGLIHSIAHRLEFGLEEADRMGLRRDVIISKVTVLEDFCPFLWPEEELEI